MTSGDARMDISNSVRPPIHTFRSSFFSTYQGYIDVFHISKSFPWNQKLFYCTLQKFAKIKHIAFCHLGLQNRENLLKSALLFSNPSSIFLSQMYLSPRSRPLTPFIFTSSQPLSFFKIFASPLTVTLPASLSFWLLGTFGDFHHFCTDLKYST